jgi:hypothetical protein
MSFFNKLLNKTEHAEIKSLTSDLKPDNWVTFYLFYFNQGIGSDASFEKNNLLMLLFVGNILSKQNTETILETVSQRHEHAAGEFMHILEKLTANDIDLLESSAGASLTINRNSGEASSKFYQSNKEIKEFISGVRSQGAVQI